MNRQDFFKKLLVGFGGLFALNSANATSQTSNNVKNSKTILGSRPKMYMAFEEMEYDSRYAEFLDKIMNYVAKDFEITAYNPEIQTILNKFFYETINIEVMLPLWTRNTAKYGNNFVYVQSENGKGVLRTKQLINFETIIGYQDGEQTYYDVSRPDVKFNKTDCINFNMITTTMQLPYGTSVLQKYINDRKDPKINIAELLRLRLAMINGLNQLAIIHLYMLGYTEDSYGFRIDLTKSFK